MSLQYRKYTYFKYTYLSFVGDSYKRSMKEKVRKKPQTNIYIYTYIYIQSLLIKRKFHI